MTMAVTDSMADPTHYDTLEVAETASQTEIKRAYRRLAKQFHPDSQTAIASHDRIARLNSAYEVLGDPQQRVMYDRQRQGMAVGDPASSARQRAQRTADLQNLYRQQRQASQSSEVQLEAWLRLTYRPVDRLLAKVITPLRGEIHHLAADPFDDDLMAGFQTYLANCRLWLGQARHRFDSMANPAATAAIAADLYHCLGQLDDGVEEMERFTLSYEESYLHTGEELFRIARQLRQQARERVQRLA